MDAIQQQLMTDKFAALDRARKTNLDVLSKRPGDARTFILTPQGAGFPNYPAPGAAALNVIMYTVPQGQNAVIEKLAIVHFGGGAPDGTGNVIWRVLINDAAYEGLDSLNSQVGTFATPVEVPITLVENDVLRITAEVPAGQPPMPPGSSTAARLHGYTFNIMRSQVVAA
jgi:hypothetical protein